MPAAYGKIGIVNRDAQIELDGELTNIPAGTQIQIGHGVMQVTKPTTVVVDEQVYALDVEDTIIVIGKNEHPLEAELMPDAEFVDEDEFELDRYNVGPDGYDTQEEDGGEQDVGQFA